mmetsp:Transcript_5906/g.13517  ORF Transcript_5906/g.13517 Transcript_5906/m.13517 type:complete len:875 (-) Transcript_5906:221-2845(-)
MTLPATTTNNTRKSRQSSPPSLLVLMTRNYKHGILLIILAITEINIFRSARQVPVPGPTMSILSDKHATLLYKSHEVDCGSALFEPNNNDTFVKTSLSPSFTMSVHPSHQDNYVSASIIDRGCFECELVKLVQTTLLSHPEAFLLDIGSNIGMYSLMSASIGRHVIAFEPAEVNRRRICQSVRRNKGFDEYVHLVPLAATETETRFTVDVPGHNKGGTRVREVATATNHDKTDTIKGMPVDYLGISHSSSPFHNQKTVIKLDVEGHEIEALMGMRNYICNAPNVDIILVLMEIRATSIEGKERATSEIFDCLSKRHGLIPFTTKKLMAEVPIHMGNNLLEFKLLGKQFLDVAWYKQSDAPKFEQKVSGEQQLPEGSPLPQQIGKHSSLSTILTAGGDIDQSKSKKTTPAHLVEIGLDEEMFSLSRSIIETDRDVLIDKESSDMHLKTSALSSAKDLDLKKNVPIVLQVNVDKTFDRLYSTCDMICKENGGGRNNHILLASIVFNRDSWLVELESDRRTAQLQKVFTSLANQGLVPIGIISNGEKVQLDIFDMTTWADDTAADRSTTLRVTWYPASDYNVKNAGFKVKRSFIDYLETLGALPKKLHILFPHKDYYTRYKDVPFVKHSILRFIEMNPRWEVTVFDDTDMDAIIRKGADDGIITQDECDILIGNDKFEGAHPVERSDLARMLIMYFFGGVYADVDTLVNSRDLDEVFTDQTKMCLPIYMGSNFQQSLLCSSPGNKIYLDIVKAMSAHRMKSNNGHPLERRGGWSHRNDLFSMGPPIYNQLVFKHVFGLHISGNTPGRELRVPIEDAMRAIEDQAGQVIATGQFKTQCDSFLARPFDGCEPRKRNELYAKFGMGGWGDAVNDRWKEGR